MLRTDYRRLYCAVDARRGPSPYSRAGAAEALRRRGARSPQRRTQRAQGRPPGGLEPEIRAQCIAVGIGRAEVKEIDTINIYHAGLLALTRAVQALDPQPQHLLIDARRLKGLPMPQQAIIKGDAKSITIGAASI